MKEQKISWKTAKLAHSKSFRKFGADFDYLSQFKNTSQINTFLPTQSLLQKWLRDKFHLDVRVASNSLTCHFPIITLLEEGGCSGKGPKGQIIIYKTYEEALEIGLQEALKLIS
jgi:hypothetical protein